MTTFTAPEGDYKPSHDESPITDENGLPVVTTAPEAVTALKNAMFTTYRLIASRYADETVSHFDNTDDDGKFAMMDNLLPFSVVTLYFCKANELAFSGVGSTLDKVRDYLDKFTDGRSIGELQWMTKYILHLWHDAPAQANKALASGAIFRVLREMSR